MLNQEVENNSGPLKKFFTALALLYVSVWLSFTPLQAAVVPNFDQKVDFNVREQNINDFLNAFFQEIDVPIQINSELEGNVNGKFKGAAGNVFDEISGAFNIVVYYDGAVAHAYQKNQISRKLLPMSSSDTKRVVSIAKSMDLPDKQNTVVKEDGGVIVRGTDKFITQIDEIIASVKNSPQKKVTKRRKVQAPAPVVEVISFPQESPVVYQIFKLKHAWAKDTRFPAGGQTIVVPGVATLLNELIQGSTREVQITDSGGNTVGSVKGQGLNRQNSNTGSELSAGLSSGANKNQNSDLPRIVPDTRLNAIVIRDYEDKMPAYRRLIESLDVESGMVEIEATIIDINTDKTRELGVNWRYQGNNGEDVLFGAGSAGDQSLIPGGGRITEQGQGGILSFSLGEPANFLARIRLLEERGAAKVISKPHVITLSDVEAVLAATTEFFVRVAGEEEVDLFNVPVGTTLRVTPHIFKDGRQSKIKLLVNIEDGSQSASTPVDNIPVIERANISTQAVINEGDSLLVGGLVRESYRNSGYQVPVLGRIPLLGRLFKSKRKTATRVERLFMITPRIASGVGFEGGQNLSTLQGSEKNIVRDSADRISTDVNTNRQEVSYWSESSAAADRKQSVLVPQKLEDVLDKTVPSKAQVAEVLTASSTAQQASDSQLVNNRQRVRSVSEQPDLELMSSKKVTATTAGNQVQRPNTLGIPVFATIEDNVFKSPFKVEQW